jgi:hypothetical protein
MVSILLFRVFLEARLLQDAVEGTGWHVHARIAGNGNGAGLRRVVELAMASLRAEQRPSVQPDELHEVTNLHAARMAQD